MALHFLYCYKLGITFAFLLVGVVGLAGNFIFLGMLISGLVKSGRRRGPPRTGTKLGDKSYGFYLSFVALCDCVNILVFNLHQIDQVLLTGGLEQSLTSIGCKLYNFGEHLFLFSSAWATLTITVERFLVLYFPLRCRRLFCQKRGSIAAVILLLFMISGYSQGYRLVFVVKGNQSCRYRQDNLYAGVYLETLVEALAFYLLPAGIMLVLNFLILGKIRRAFSWQLEHGNFVSAGGGRTISVTGVPSTSSRSSGLVKGIVTTSPTGHTTNAPECQQCHQMNRTVINRTVTSRRRATGILVAITTTYIVLHLPQVMTSLYFACRINSLRELVRQAARIGNNSESSLLLTTQLYVRGQFTNYMNYGHDLTRLSSLLSCGSNFYIYFFFGSTFRRDVLDFLSDLCCCCPSLAVVFSSLSCCLSGRNAAALPQASPRATNDNQIRMFRLRTVNNVRREAQGRSRKHHHHQAQHLHQQQKRYYNIEVCQR